jgi:hypothetical protein
MIEAEGKHAGNWMNLVITFPGKNETEVKSIFGETIEEREKKGWQIIYELNKNRISEILCKWLKHQQLRLEKYQPARSQKAAQLLVLMHFQNQFHFFQLCQQISTNRGRIEDLVPSKDKEAEFKYYQTEIVKILNDCDWVCRHRK